MTQTHLHRRALLAAVGLAVPACAFARQQAGPFRFAGWRGEETDAERGFFEVPEDRSDPRSRRIRLGYVRFRSTAARPGRPIVYLAGGPGGTATGTATGPRFPIFMALRSVADVIAFDQRGTGLSNSIPARAPSTAPVPAFTRDGLTQDIRREFQAAWADWTAQGVAMGGYNTEQNADDIDDLRRHLGVEKIDLWGISYGSHLALSVLKRHGDRIGRVALASLEGQDQTVKRPDRLDAYLARVDNLLDAAPPLRAAIPDLPGLMRRVHARLDVDPATVMATRAGAPIELRVSGFAVQIIAGNLIANPETLSILPGLYLALDAGMNSLMSNVVGDADRWLGISGMPEAMDLASGISPERLALVTRDAPTAVLGDALNYPMPHLLGAVPGVDLGEAFRSAMRIDTPALLVAGTLDGRTPLEEQAEVALQFRNRTQVFVENAGHNVFEAHPDVQDILVRFFNGDDVSDIQLSNPPPVFRLG
jgi:pimeloyl-ACP methyl ester carboxylesterase